MTIRTIEDHLKLNTDEKLQYSNYLPVSLAYLLPCLFQTFADVSEMKDEESCRAEMKVVQTILDSNSNLTVKGFKPSHKCELDYSKNLRTFAEAHQNIDGKPSIGIQFTDADDGYNDWVWVAVDVIRDFRYTTLSFRSDETERLYSEIKRMSGPKPDEPEKPKETQMCKTTDDSVPKRKPSNNLGKILFGALALPFVGIYVSILTLGYLLFFVPFVVLMSLGMIVPEMIYLGVVVLPVAFWRKAVFGEEISFPEIVSTEMLVEGLKSMWHSYTMNVGRVFFR